MGAQLPLNIQLRDDATLTSFYAGADNPEALLAVTQMAQGVGEPFVYLWGPAGAGRTHLLQAASHAASECGMASLYIPLQTKSLSSTILQGAEGIPLVCIDDIQNIAGQPGWEEGLFHLFNRIQMQKSRLLVAADVAPKNLKIILQDLQSRLSSGVVYQLHALNDEHKIKALQLRAIQRGLDLPDAVGGFLLSRCPRNMSELFLTLEKLDRASLAEQRRLTVPFVKQVLEL